tara:strand:+ start:1961 stop:2476 length:516 start_codon:yes stop_codon:yes gene_type:complete
MKALCGEIPKAELWIRQEKVVDLNVQTAVVLETPNGNVFCGYFPPGVHDLRPPVVKTKFDMQHIFKLCRYHCEFLLGNSPPHARARRCMKRALVSSEELQLLSRLDNEHYVAEPGRRIPYVTDEVEARIRDIYATVYSDEVGGKDAGPSAGPSTGPSGEASGQCSPTAGRD